MTAPLGLERGECGRSLEVSINLNCSINEC
jgi:hypothetical protein